MRRGFVETVPVGGNGRARAIAAPSHSSQHQQIAESRALIGQFFADLRRALRLTLPQAADYLQVQPEVIEALETGRVEDLPEWEETAAIIMTYASMADVNGRPALNAVSGLIAFIAQAAPEPRRPTITERLQEQQWEPHHFHADQYHAPYQPPFEAQPQVAYQPPVPYQPQPFPYAQPQALQPLQPPRATAIQAPVPAPVPLASHAAGPFAPQVGAHSVAHFSEQAPVSAGSYAGSRAAWQDPSGTRAEAQPQARSQPVRAARIQAAGNLARAGSVIADHAKRLPEVALNQVRQRPQRALYALSLPLGLLLLMMHSSIFATVSGPFGSAVRWVSSYFQEHYGPVRDGLRYVEVEDPRSRRGDKLQISGGSY